MSLILNNQPCPKADSNYLMLESEFIEAFLTDPASFESLTLKIAHNDCDNYYSQTIIHETVTEHPGCSSLFTSTLDLAPILDTQSNIIEMRVKDVSTNVITTMSITTNFNQVCYTGAGNIIDGCPGATQLMADINNWFLTNYGSGVNMQIVNNVLYLCGLNIDSFPPLVLLNADYTDGVETYTQNFTSYNTFGITIIDGTKIGVTPEFFGKEEILDGVYSIVIDYKYDNGIIKQEKICQFVDINTKCEVAKYLKDFLESDTKEKATTIHMMHYALSFPGECTCNCKDLIDLYKLLLQELNIKLDNNGCQVCSNS